jgi:hypothetical protein
MLDRNTRVSCRICAVGWDTINHVALIFCAAELAACARPVVDPVKGSSIGDADLVENARTLRDEHA